MVLASPFPDVEIPNASVVDFLIGDLTRTERERTAIVESDSGAVVTYGQLEVEVARAAEVVRADVGVGQVVALMGPNCIAWVVAFLGAIRSGAVVTTVNVMATTDDVAKQLRDSGAVQVLVADTCSEVARSAAARVGLPEASVVTLPMQGVDAEAGGGFGAAEPIRDPASQLAVLPYSSGTTGAPKGVMLTHRNLVANVCQVDGLLGVDENSSVLALLPFSHIYGMTVVLHLALRRRAKLVILPRFDVDDFLAVSERERVTHLFVAPPVVVALAKSESVGRYDLSCLKLLLSGAAPLDENLADAVADKLGCQVRQAYGMSEMSPVSHIAPLGELSVAPSSVGFTVPNMVCKLVDPITGVDLPLPAQGVSDPGELCCAGPNVMLGYLGNDEATQSTIDADGYLHTGDLATVDASGFVTVVDRLKELIKYKGYQVAPAELEGLLLEHADIVDAAVVGVSVGEAGDEAPRAFVVRRPGAHISEEDVIEYVAERVAPYKKVREVLFTDVIPKSPSGKILRRNLR